MQEFCDQVRIPYTIYGFVEGNREVLGRLGEVAKQARMLEDCRKFAAERGVFTWALIRGSCRDCTGNPVIAFDGDEDERYGLVSNTRWRTLYESVDMKQECIDDDAHVK